MAMTRASIILVGTAVSFLVHSAMGRGREGVAQTEAENVIKELVRAGIQNVDIRHFGHFSGSSWAVKKALHFALLALCVGGARRS